MYTVKFQTGIYVLHVFQKKSRKGIATPKEHIDMVKRRLRQAAEMDAQIMGQKEKRKRSITMNDKDYTISSDNVFADLGMPDAEERLMRVRLLSSIIMEISRRGLTQHEIASLLDIPQFRVSHLLEARLSRFSLESLQQMSVRLGMDVAISH